MKWYCVLKEGEHRQGLSTGRLYEYKTTRDYDAMFTVFNGTIWLECDADKFNMYYLVK